MPYYNRDPKRDHNFDNHPPGRNSLHPKRPGNEVLHLVGSDALKAPRTRQQTPAVQLSLSYDSLVTPLGCPETVAKMHDACFLALDEVRGEKP